MSEDNQKIKKIKQQLECSVAVLNRSLRELEDDSKTNEESPLYLRFSKIHGFMQEILLAEEFSYLAATLALNQYTSQLEQGTMFFEGPQK